MTTSAYTDIRWTGDPATMARVLTDLGHPAYAPEDTPLDPRIHLIHVAHDTVMGRAVTFVLITVDEGVTIEAPEGVFVESGPSHFGVTGVRAGLPSEYVPVWLIRERAEQAGIWETLSFLIEDQSPEVRLKLLTLEQGIARTDPMAQMLITQAGGDPVTILAPR